MLLKNQFHYLRKIIILNENDNIHDFAQRIELRILSKDMCNSVFYIAGFGGLEEIQFCAGPIDEDENLPKTSCDGDSGSPLVVEGRVAGITAWSNYPCGLQNSPGVFTEVSKYRTWIAEEIKNCEKCTDLTKIARLV